jgi:glucose-1-phosphate cytidylyltransferase
MKVVILCGGLGTRLSEETHIRPKPMVEIGGRPILWHIMRSYDHHDLREFVLALGYKGEQIKDYFLNYHARQSDVTLQLRSGAVTFSNPTVEDWTIDLVDTGASTQTGGRLLRLREQLKSLGTFMLTYGDGVSNVDLRALLAFHRAHGRIATVTAVRPAARFGELQLDGKRVVSFAEKPQIGEGWVSGGFFVFEPAVFNYIDDDATMLERAPLENLARAGELMAFHHSGYWHPMDTVRDKTTLEALWAAGAAPWAPPS